MSPGLHRLPKPSTSPHRTTPTAGFVLTAVLLNVGTANLQGIGRDTMGVIVDRVDAAVGTVPRVRVFDPRTDRIAAVVPPPTPPGTGVFDLALTSDGRCLLATSGYGLADGGSGMGVIDVQHRAVASTLDFLPFSPTVVEVAPDGSVLDAELRVSPVPCAQSVVHRFMMDSGTLVDTGQAVGTAGSPGIQDMLVPPYPHLPAAIEQLRSRHMVRCPRPAGETLGTIRVAGLEPVGSVPLAFPTGIDLTLDWLRNVVYVRTNELGASGPAGVGHSRIDGYFLNPVTDDIQQQVSSIDLERRAGTAFSCEQTAIDPVERKLYVSGLAGGEVRVFRPADVRAGDDHVVAAPDLGTRRRGAAALARSPSEWGLAAKGPPDPPPNIDREGRNKSTRRSEQRWIPAAVLAPASDPHAA